MFGFGKTVAKDNWGNFEIEAMPHSDDLYRVAMWLVRDTEEAQDLTQETLMQGLRSFHRYELGTNCKAWLMTIMYHLNSKRKMKLGRLQLVEDTEERIAETIAFEPSIPQNITDGEVLEALKRVPQQFSQVVVLADVEDFAYKEISQILDVPIGTVMSRLHRGRKLLRVELANYARNYGFGRENKEVAQ
jgi:RNA polymerase sigma-70 factor (ECF subfamily)